MEAYVGRVLIINPEADRVFYSCSFGIMFGQIDTNNPNKRASGTYTFIS
ncbi:hypothetical protein [Bacillus sp. AFS015896]|nr:hypothetical protein [Bacillus sp. AFS015896]